MTPSRISPGDVLAGRYRLDDLLADTAGARFWRATDTVLARSVAVHAISSADDRAARLLGAARTSATFADPRLLRVLDCDDTNDITWVVNEWGDGLSLDLILQQDTLSPSRAAWLVREVAETIASGHQLDSPHGRLNPEAVMVTHAGAVKLIGYAVDATLVIAPEEERRVHPEGRPIEQMVADDVCDLAGILYAALTGRWAGRSVSAVPAAPREHGSVLRPRQVRAGVPRALDEICEQVLNKNSLRHGVVIESAVEIAAALSDFVGDPAAVAPLDVAGVYAEPTVSVRRDQTSDSDTGTGSGTSTGATGASAASGEDDVTGSYDALEATQAALSPAAHLELEETQVAVLPVSRRTEVVPPPPPYEEPPERPLFADSERRVPPSSRPVAPSVSSTGESAASGGGGAGSTVLIDPNTHGPEEPAGEFWPFGAPPGSEQPHGTGKEGRGWLRIALAMAGLIVLVIAALVVLRPAGIKLSNPIDNSPDSPSASTAPQGQDLQVVAAKDFDPDSSGKSENPDLVPDAVDGDPATSWRTMTYYGSARLGGLKPGVGLILDLGKQQEPRQVRIRFEGQPTSVRILAASGNTLPTSTDGLRDVGGKNEAGQEVSISLRDGTTARYVVVWLTSLPPVSGGYRGAISEVSVRS